MGLIPLLLAVMLFGLAGLVIRRVLDQHLDRQAWASLISMAGPPTGVFDPDMVRDLPAAARRYFSFTIREGAPLCRSVEIAMTGSLGLGNKSNPKYRPMQARQLLAPFHGLVWRLKAGSISGSDGETPTNSWTRFWLYGLLPVVRAGGDTNHKRSAFGRLVSEAAFWLPASLLPGEHVSWESLDEHRARAVVRCGEFRQAVDITVAADGQPTQIVIQRWSNENAEHEFREQPFGGELSGFQMFAGYRLPTCVEGGNHFGTDDYFPSYKVRVDHFRFDSAADRP